MMNTSVISNSEIKIHKSCMVKEVLKFLEPENKEIIIDATFGTGGHSKEILNHSKNLKLLAFEKDPDLYILGKELEEKYKNFKIFNESYAEIPVVLKNENIDSIDGILFDFGVSFYHIASSNRGFTFKKNETLDMRYNPESGKPLNFYINKIKEKELEFILKEYGEIRNYKKIARNILSYRKRKKIETTFDLNEAILKGVKGNREKILQKVYQAFRIWINEEIKNIQKVLEFLPLILKSKGRCVFLTYHSIEDRLIKNFLKRKDFKNLTKKPLIPQREEIKEKPNCRSCKLRAGEKL